MTDEVVAENVVVEKVAKPKRVTGFDKIVEGLKTGPKTADEIAAIIVASSPKEGYTLEAAKKTISVRVNNIRKKGFNIKRADGKYILEA